MGLNYLERTQFIPASLDKVWDFFSRPQNLKAITPEKMNFQIVKQTGMDRAFAGQMIEYRVTVPPGVRMKWLTEITHVEDQKMFVDEQRVGPYSIWHHEHHFEEKDGGVEMRDVITYKMPFGLLGKLAHGFAKKELEAIFDYRTEVTKKLFN